MQAQNSEEVIGHPQESSVDFLKCQDSLEPIYIIEPATIDHNGYTIFDLTVKQPVLSNIIKPETIELCHGEDTIIDFAEPGVVDLRDGVDLVDTWRNGRVSKLYTETLGMEMGTPMDAVDIPPSLNSEECVAEVEDVLPQNGKPFKIPTRTRKSLKPRPPKTKKRWNDATLKALNQIIRYALGPTNVVYTLTEKENDLPRGSSVCQYCLTPELADGTSHRFPCIPTWAVTESSQTAGR